MEEWHRHDHKEAKEICEGRMERQLQIQSEMMQMFMVSMINGHPKRMRKKSGDNDDEEQASYA